MNYPANLCDLPPDQQRAIEQDRAKWHRAWRIYQQIHSGRRSKPGVRQWLDTLPSEEAQDLRRRLNTIAADHRTKPPLSPRERGLG